MTKGRCKHCSRQGLKTICALGLDLEGMAKAACNPDGDYRDGLALRLPCDTKEWTLALWNREGKASPSQLNCIAQKATCLSFTDPTDDEIATDKAEMDAAMDRMRLVYGLIGKVKKEHTESWSGIEKCPACGGKLHLRLNCFFSEYQGSNQKHLHGKCETAGCVSWME